MLIRITFKSPDAVYEALKDQLGECPMDECGRDEWEESKREIKETVSRFVKYDEYVAIEFDTVAKTARVIPQRS